MIRMHLYLFITLLLIFSLSNVRTQFFIQTQIFCHRQMEQESRKKDDLIFFVLPNQQVNLATITANSLIVQGQVQHDLTLQGTVNALKYRFPLKFLGKNYSELVVSCMPAKQPQLVSVSTESKQNRSQESFPFFVKVPENSEYKGYASGKRSAIYKVQNQFLRYKGCGNFLQGFAVQKNEPRGCHYFHTSKRQLLMTRKINEILLKELGVSSGNIPKHAFEYKPEQILKLNLKCESEMIGKYCCVFETTGDRRIGTHVISPLEILFLNLCNLEKTPWFEIFEKNRRIDSGQPIEFLANWIFLEPNQTFLKTLLDLKADENFITLDKIELQNIDTDKKNLFVQKVLEKLVKNNHEKEEVENYIKTLTSQFKETVTALVQKIGYEMGEIKRIFCDYEINWGYFNDHGTLWHCNAHLNNFVSTVPKAQSQFLVPLDFDLAFFKKQFIRIDLDQQAESSYGKLDEFQFENFLCSEYQAMQMSVSGMEVMSNFKYSIDYDEKQQINPLSPVKMARIVFRDTLLKAFRQGMRKNIQQKDRINNKWDQLIAPITDLVKICLIISQDFQT